MQKTIEQCFVTPATAKRKKREENDLILGEDDDDDDDDMYDADQAEMNRFTHAYCTQADIVFHDGMTHTVDLSQCMPGEEVHQEEEQADAVVLPDASLIPAETLPRDSEQQVSVDCGGTLRIFKRGESFKANIEAGRLCVSGKNKVPQGVTEAVYTILGFYNENLKKTAECQVRIPVYQTIPPDEDGQSKCEKEWIKQLFPNEYVILRWSERIELRNLSTRLPDTHVMNGDLRFRVTLGVNGVSLGNNFSMDFEEPQEMAKSFYMMADPFSTKELKPTVLEIFAGAGGMSKGFANAGFNVQWMVEKDPQSAATLRINHQHGQARVFEESVQIFLNKSIAGKKGYPAPKDVHHLHASSPCQGYSKANRFGGVNDRANNELAFMWLDYIRYFQPETASFENVTGMLLKTGQDNDGDIWYLYRLIYTLLLKINYQVRTRVVMASDYGDPQNRQRIFILAAKQGRPLPQWPKASHGVGLDKPHVTVRDVLKDLESIEPDEEGGNGMVELPDGTMTYDHCFAGKKVKADSHKLDADKPSNTVRRTNGLEHYSLERNITIREMARLQSFPDNYEMCGTATQKKSQIGNAVPVHLAEAIATTIFASLH